MVDPQVTIVVPYHQARAENGMLDTCLWSLRQQVGAPPFVVLPVLDDQGEGAAATRQRGLDMADTPWVGFLDSDDWVYPDHVGTLYHAALDMSADYVFSWYTVHDMWEGARPDLDPLGGLFGVQFDNDHPHQTTGTTLVYQDLLWDRGIRFREQLSDRFIPDTELRYGEDWDLVLQCAAAGLRIRHVPRRTWAWRIGHHNTSGLPGHGDSGLTKKGQ